MKSTKMESLLQQFYAKTAQIIVQSRIASYVGPGARSCLTESRKRPNKWVSASYPVQPGDGGVRAAEGAA